MISHRQRIAAIIAGSAGNLIEWYDFYVYAYVSIYFAADFFPAGNRTVQLLNVAGVYAAGFLIRPFGGWFFGRFGDRNGRRAAMVFSVLLMGLGALMFALLPTYASVGPLAPALLLVARLAQGFSSGGQYGAAAAYLSEISEPKTRGFYASFQFVTLIGGQLCALLVIVAMQAAFSDHALREWAWRLPFLLAAGLAGTIVIFRNVLHETVDVQSRPADAGTMRSVLRHWRSLLIVGSIAAGGSVVLYTFTTYMQKFLVNTAGLGVKTASAVMLAAMLVYLLVQPVLGALSDRIGRRTCLRLFGGLMTVGAVPLLMAISHASGPIQAFLLVAGALVILSFYTSVSGLFKSELFPVHVRTLGVGLAHTVSAAIFGGTAEYFALYAKELGHEQIFFWYVAGISAVSFVTALVMREPRSHGLLT